MGRGEREAVARGVRLREAARSLAEDHERAVAAVRAALKPLHDAAVAQALDTIPVARLQDVTGGRLRLGAVEKSGLDTVRAVLDAGPYRLRQIPGVGQRTVDQIVAAARQLAEAAEESAAVHLDVDRPEPRTTALVGALHVLVGAGPQARRAVDAAAGLTRRLDPLLADARPAAGRIGLLLAGRERKNRALEAVAAIRSLTEEADREGTYELLAQASVDLLRGPPGDLAAWTDFELRSAEYYGLLGEIAGRAPDTAAAEGFLPDEIAERVRGLRLDDSHRRVSLRGYQAFGARFALARRRVILGDEMGLGKTIQAIAALAHLAAGGRTHFMVVCPASVLVNWTREIDSRSTLRALPLHGPDRQDAFADWRERGGVAVTTFEALRGFPASAADELGMLVVDEAHSVKNPQALRSQAVDRWAGRCEHVLLMTGTPMENRVAEFRNLVRMLDADVADRLEDGAGLAGSVAFRKAVAPVYLRRNQADVLTELPSLQHTDEWEELSAADQDAYREAVRDGNFMAMRRAAYARPEKSAKLGRLREIVREAGENGLKVIVFSHFRDVLDAVRAALAAEAPDSADASAAASATAPGTGTGTAPDADTASAPDTDAEAVTATVPTPTPTPASGEPAPSAPPGPHGPVFGPLTGSVPPARRQLLVDEFTAVSGPAVLLAQIQAAGVGLNLQAASVVIICEPQIKPTIEHQAVARAHRMGQVRPVRVHRLLATGGVDERMVRMLERKARLFDAYARRSEVAEATPDAVDVSDTDLARRIVEEEQARLGVGDGQPAPAP